MLIRLLQRAHVDRAVAYNLLATVCRLVTGPVTAVLIGSRFSPELQGYHYAFIGLIALQLFTELGLPYVIVQFASHESERLQFGPRGEITGELRCLKRLNHLGQLSIGWFLAAGLLTAGGLGLAGSYFFSHSPAAGVVWQAPWLAWCAVTGGRLWLVPLWSLLEGCNQTRIVYAFRFWDTLGTALLTWLLILQGAGLWVLPCANGLSLLASAAYLGLRYRGFLALFLKSMGERELNWSKDLWPMQWRIALTSISGFFGFYLFVPVTFHFHGPIAAGQLGMVLNLTGVVAPLAAAWVVNKTPRFGQLVAKRAWGELDTLFFRLYGISVLVASAACLAMWGGVVLLNWEGFPLARRLLGPLATGLFLLGAWFQSISVPLGLYMRAHKQEPVYHVSVAYGVAMALVIVGAGSRYGPISMAVGYILCSFLALVWIAAIWSRCRREWHGSAPP